MGCKLKRTGGDNLRLCLEIWERNVGQTLWRSSACLEVSQEYSSFTERAGLWGCFHLTSPETKGKQITFQVKKGFRVDSATALLELCNLTPGDNAPALSNLPKPSQSSSSSLCHPCSSSSPNLVSHGLFPLSFSPPACTQPLQSLQNPLLLDMVVLAFLALP